MPPNEEEITNITNGMMQNCTVVQQKKEPGNERKETGMQSLCQENGDKFVNGSVKDVQAQKAEIPKGDTGKDVSPLPREKSKEHEPANKDPPRLNRNGLGPRFKKNSDSKCRLRDCILW